MKKHYRLGLAIAPLIFLFAGFVWYNGFVAHANENQQPVSLKDLRLFSDVYGYIKSDYVEKVPDQKLIEGAIRGMLAALDPYSVFLSRREYNDLKISTTGKFGGLGIEVSMKDGLVEVVAPIEDTPAAKAGLLPGDLIGQINGEQVRGMALSDAVDKMRGPVGTKVKLVIVRDEKLPFEVEVTRAIIKIKSVKNALIEDQFGYLRITKFQTKTANLLGKKTKRTQARSPQYRRGRIERLNS